MRTKALLGLAALAVGLSTSVAQNVYSLNVVGYVNVSLQANKLHFLSLPVAPVDGNFNITNTIVLDSSQTFANLYRWAGTSWDAAVPSWTGTAWDTPMVIPNGTGFFISSQAASTLTFVGQVPQGAIQYSIPVGLSTLANQVPVSTNFPGAAVGGIFDNILTWDLAGQAWSTAVWSYNGTAWDNGLPGANANGPLLNPADAVFYQNANTAINFTQNFTVQ
jgi:hypothetical protein